MGLRAPSLADMDAFEVSRKRKPVKLSNARSVNLILWRVDGSAVVAHSGRTTDCCTNTIWRRMMSARHVGRNKQPCNHRETEDAADEHLDHDSLELGEPHRSPLMKDTGSKLQSSFNMAARMDLTSAEPLCIVATFVHFLSKWAFITVRNSL